MIKKNTPSLCLGTVQFGLDYGITNKKGIIDKSQCQNIFKKIAKSDIKFLDTAQSYGKAEVVIGDNLNYKNSLKIISKLSKINLDEDLNINKLDKNFKNTLSNLRVESINSFLFHNVNDLKSKKGKEILDWLKSLKDRKKIERIGISIYDPSDLNNLSLEDIQIVQLPLSIYDQRMIISGAIKFLKEKKIDIHARSIFLQGLFLEESKNWPSFLTSGFHDHHNQTNQKLNKYGISNLEASLEFVSNLKDIEAIVFGISKIKDLNEILEIWGKLKTTNKITIESYSDFVWGNSKDLDPRYWPTRT